MITPFYRPYAASMPYARDAARLMMIDKVAAP